MSKLNPIQKTWMIISTLFGAIGLVNITEDVYKWAPFFQVLISQYKSIWYLLFNWLPFCLDNWLKEYVFFGALFISNTARATYRIFKGAGLSSPAFFEIIVVLILVILWPIIVLFFLGYSIRSIITVKKNQFAKDSYIPFLTLQLIGSTLLWFFVLLTISSIFTN